MSCKFCCIHRKVKWYSGKNKLENNMNNMTMYTTFQIWLCLTFHNELMYLQVSGPPYA